MPLRAFLRQNAWSTRCSPSLTPPRRLGVLRAPLARLRLDVVRLVRLPRACSRRLPAPRASACPTRSTIECTFSCSSSVAQELAHREHVHLAVLLRGASCRTRGARGSPPRPRSCRCCRSESISVSSTARLSCCCSGSSASSSGGRARAPVAVLLEGGRGRASLRLLQDRVAVLVQLPEDAEQAVLGLDVAVHLVRQRRAEDVGDARVVADVAPPIVEHVLRRAEIGLHRRTRAAGRRATGAARAASRARRACPRSNTLTPAPVVARLQEALRGCATPTGPGSACRPARCRGPW